MCVMVLTSSCIECVPSVWCRQREEVLSCLYKIVCVQSCNGVWKELCVKVNCKNSIHNVTVQQYIYVYIYIYILYICLG
jgi:hypothetical protein